MQYALALQKIEKNKNKTLEKSTNLSTNFTEKTKIQSLDYENEIEKLKSKVENSVRKMQDSFVEKKIEVERSYKSYQNLIKDISDSQVNIGGPNKSELLMKEIREFGISMGDKGSRRRAEPREL